MLQRNPSLRSHTALHKGPKFHGLFLRHEKFLLQNRAIVRNTLRILNRQIPSVNNAVQSSEMMRNSLGLNYKSAALPAELCAAKMPRTLMHAAA
ncbi:MAG: hypothetical protein DME55_06720 [Verrucomicrobia bacterium]|nr:MAG: hypothetical protein DME55_06720 [Verrucomicrobiota bacterium]